MRSNKEYIGTSKLSEEVIAIENVERCLTLKDEQLIFLPHITYTEYITMPSLIDLN